MAESSRLYRVLVTDYVPDATVEQEVLDGLAVVEALRGTSEADVVPRLRDADGVIAFHKIAFTELSLGHMPKCRVLVRDGVGFDNVDIAAAGRHGIVVCNVPDYGNEEVADHALMFLLALARRLRPAHESVAAGGWEVPELFTATRLRGRTVGIVGLGRIGSAFALRAKAVGLRVVFHDPFLPQGYDKALGIDRVHTLDELLHQSEYLSLHCPLNASTRHLLNAQTLARLPRGATVINTARGGIVDLDALADALDAGQVGYAGLDVFENEPLDHQRIRRHPRVLLSPHTAFFTIEGMREMRVKGAEEVKRALLGEAVRNPVNRHVLVNPRCRLPMTLTEVT
jgi:D-3-phosphoglycerate dehydrogenase